MESFTSQTFALDKIIDFSNITCGYSMVLHEQVHLFTGHENGLILHWVDNKIHQKITLSKKYSKRILQIVHNDIGFFVLLEKCRVVVWNQDFSQELKKIDLYKKRILNPAIERFV